MDDSGKGTRLVRVDAMHPDLVALQEAAQILRLGGLVAFPTETVYGLGANALDEAAVARIFTAKGRPSDNPLIVHIADWSMIERVAAEIPAKAYPLIKQFWPGPLTLVLPKAKGVGDSITAGLSTVGVRMPDHPIALALLRLADVPVAAPSANLSGRPSPTTADHVMDDLSGRIDMIIDGGNSGVGLESTVLDMTVDPPVLLRPGGVTLERLTAVIGPIHVDHSVDGSKDSDTPRSPGMKYTHYAPKAPVILIEGPVLAMQAKICDLIYEYQEEGQRVGVMCSIESRGVYAASVVLEHGSRADLAGVASDLFATLRAFNRHDVHVILVEGVPATGIGLAIMNRLRRAASGQVVEV